jgi:hypothetical protein
VIEENVYEDNGMAVKIPLMIYYVKSIDWKLWIHPWQIEHQRSINDFCTFKFANDIVIWLGFCNIKVSATLIGQRECDTLPASSG